MKRVLVLLLSFMLLLLSGCSNSVPEDIFLSDKPWAAASSTLGEEICKYKITRYAGSESDGKVITTLDSALTYTLKTGYSYNLTTGEIFADTGSVLLIVQSNVTYFNSEDVHETLRGKSESITSYCVFDKYDLKPKLNYRKAETVEAAHELLLDYSQKKATLKNSSGESTLKIKSDGYDNESLYYIIRSLNTVKEGGTATLPLILAYDDFNYKNGSVKSKEIIQSTAAELKDITVEPSIYRQFFSGTPENYTLACLETSIALNTAKSGPATKLYYAKQETRIASTDINSVSYVTKNILIRFEYPLYGFLSGSLGLDYTQVFQLIEYSNK